MQKTVFLLFFLSAIHLQGQPTITNAFNPMVGDAYAITQADTTGIMPGNAGANQTWNFSNLVATTTLQVNILLPSSTPYVGSYPSATTAQPTTTAGEYAYVKTTANAYEYLGAKSSFYASILTDGRMDFQYPISYNSSYSDLYSGTMGYGAGTSYSRKGSINVVADGWGTLITPSGTYMNTLRLKMQETTNDTSLTGNPNPNITIGTTYLWLSPSSKQPLLKISFLQNTFLGTVSKLKIVEYSSATTSVEVPLLASELLISPNPTNGNLNLQAKFLQNENLITVALFTLEGKEVMRRNEKVEGKETVTWNYDITHLSKGMYILKLQSPNSIPLCKKIMIE